MLDKLNTKLLKELNNLCDGGSYKVLELNEIIASMPKFKMQFDTLKQNLEYLKEREYLDIKYFDENEVCLCVMPKGRLHSEEIAEQKKQVKSFYKVLIVTSISSALFAFLGALLGWIVLK